LISFTKAEKEFLLANEACRLATCHDNMPHVVPVSYVFEGGAFYFATDLETRKLENVKKNDRVALQSMSTTVLSAIRQFACRAAQR
jgi:nitroimidazol reductase NimA-like FMN-containing flavoprotein (pyridoxamine 5'-phosphate oxidase superfamily)